MPCLQPGLLSYLVQRAYRIESSSKLESGFQPRSGTPAVTAMRIKKLSQTDRKKIDAFSGNGMVYYFRVLVLIISFSSFLHKLQNGDSGIIIGRGSGNNCIRRKDRGERELERGSCRCLEGKMR